MRLVNLRGKTVSLAILLSTVIVGVVVSYLAFALTFTSFTGGGDFTGGFGCPAYNGTIKFLETGVAANFGTTPALFNGPDLVIDATAGAGDCIHTGDGNDTIILDVGLAGADIVFGDAGNDTITDLSAGGDTLNGGEGNDTISGGTGADTINGDEGNDTIRDGTGADTIIGGSGNDRITLIADGAVEAVVDAGSGHDRITILAGSAPAGGEDIICGTGNDTVIFMFGPGIPPIRRFPVTDPVTGGIYTNASGDCERVFNI